jgi:tRNA(Ile)-lysidine synthase
VTAGSFSWPPMVAEVASRCDFPTGPLDCAVSGGADSMALVALAVFSGCSVTAWHVRHGLRPASESTGEPEAIATMLEPLGVALRVVDLEVAIDLASGNVEERAREGRYAALPHGVAVGHTADDLAETVIAHIIRGTGLDGLAPMRSPDRVRPLLGIRRTDTEAVCSAMGWAPLEDSMNSDSRYVRVRVRSEVLPLLHDVAGRDVVPLLARLASVSSDDIAVLDSLADRIDPTNCLALRQAPEALGRRAVRRWLTSEMGGADGVTGHAPDLATVDRVLAVARLEALGTDIGRGFRVLRRLGGRLELIRPD